MTFYIIRLANVYDIDLEKSIYLKEKINARKYNRKSICDKDFLSEQNIRGNKCK